MAPWLLAIAGAVQLAYWAKGDKALENSGTNLGTATGLGDRGAVRAFEPPHTGSNYLLREFVHVVGRKHAQKLRMIAFILGFALPLLLILTPVQGYRDQACVCRPCGAVASCRRCRLALAFLCTGRTCGRPLLRQTLTPSGAPQSGAPNFLQVFF